MDTQQKILTVFNSAMGILRSQEKAVSYLESKATSAVEKEAISLFKNGSEHLQRIGPVLDIVRRHLYPNRVLLNELASHVGEGRDDKRVDAALNRIKEIAQKNTDMAPGFRLALDVLANVEIDKQAAANVIKAMSLVVRLCDNVAVIDNWEKRGTDVYRLFK